MVSFFGWQIKRVDDTELLATFAPPVVDDGAVVVSAGGNFGHYVDLDGSVKTEADLVTKYRELAMQPEVDHAVCDICNEVIVYDEEKETVEIQTEDIPFAEPIKQMLEDEFKEIKKLLEFNTHAYDIFQRFYVDGRLYYHAMIDPKQPQAGIQELRFLDPRKIRKIREVSKNKDPKLGGVSGGDQMQKVVQEYYIYNEKGLGSQAASTPGIASPMTGIKIAPDTVVHITSGILDTNHKLVLSWLHKALRPANLFITLENAMTIYRLARAPERRIFYVDIGNLPKLKAEQYIQEMMAKYKNKVVYDAETGSLRNDKKFMTMLEDFWLPTRGNGQGTKIDTLPGSNNTGVLEEVEFFKQKLYNALNVPFSRTNPDMMYTYGASAEISRDEVKFGMFVDRLRLRFNNLFLEIMERNMILKGLIVPEEWDQIRHHIKFKYAKNNLFSELKDGQVLGMRMNNLQLIMPFVGRYYSNEEVRRKVLGQSDEDIERNDMQIAQEVTIPQYAVPTEPGQQN